MQNLELIHLIIIFILGLINSILILFFSKEQFKESIIATVRSLVQLMILGLVLEKVFLLNTWYLKILAIFFILFVGANTLRSKINSQHVKYYKILISMGLSILPALICSYFILENNFFTRPYFLIPYIGMLIGNSLTGLNLGLRGFYKDLESNKDNIITYLSLRANNKEALNEFVIDAMKNGLTPIINTMLVVGLVSIPGLMTGQMMAGANPFLSARYQYFLIIMIQSTVLIGLLSYFGILLLRIKKETLLEIIGEEHV